MLFILLGLFLIMFIIGFIVDNDDDLIKRTGGIGAILMLGTTLIVLSCHNDIKSVNSEKIAFLEKNNIEVLETIEPLVLKYIKYENETFTNLKPNSNTLIALSAYPELKTNELVQKQIDIVLNNNEEIKNLKLELIGLDSYKLWIFMGK